MPESPVTAPRIRRVTVVVPAYNEEATVGAAIDGIRAAANHLPSVSTEIVVVANGCVDRTESVARERGAHVLNLGVPNVGAARAAGATWALEQSTADLWLATTDADSVVPSTWLSAQIHAADEGFDVFLGTVVLAAEDAAEHASWAAAYALHANRDTIHGHVHGANLGVRASAYVRAGGFQPLPAHEDADLVRRLRALGAAITWAPHVPVLTSARHDPRAVAGVGTDLAASG